MSYFSKVGDDCQFTVDNARAGCRDQAAAAQFVKVAVFGSPGKGDRLGTECLWDLARKCNPRIRDAVDACLESTSVVNFVQADYPNYPASRYLTLVDYCKALNLDRARRMERRRRLYTRLSQDVRKNMRRRRGRSRTMRNYYNNK